MPTARCTRCSKRVSVDTKDWKYLHSIFPYVCSIECVWKWIRGTTSNVHPEYWGAVPTEQGDHPNFRSLLEQRFANAAEKVRLVYQFEPYVFPVGQGSYTPDFYFPATGVFVETKGAWAVGAKGKMRKFKSQYPTVPLLIIPWTLGRELDEEE